MSNRLPIAALFGLMVAGCAATPRVPAPIPEPSPQVRSAFVGACSSADPTASCIHEIPDGWSMMTAGVPVPGSGLLMSTSARRSVLVKRHEVTQDEWSWLMQSDPSFFSGCPDCPVERVSWWDALAYMNRLSIADGFKPCYELRSCTGEVGSGCPGGRPWCESRFSCESVTFAGTQCSGYRLPTSDEWRWVTEATAADPASVSFPWCADISQGRPRPVSKLEADAVDGVTGNVWEWTWNAVLDGALRAHRGGSFRTSPTDCDAAAESAASPRVRSYFVGFRPMRTLPLPLARPAQPRSVGPDTVQMLHRGILTPASTP